MDNDLSVRCDLDVTKDINVFLVKFSFKKGSLLAS